MARYPLVVYRSHANPARSRFRRSIGLEPLETVPAPSWTGGHVEGWRGDTIPRGDSVEAARQWVACEQESLRHVMESQRNGGELLHDLDCRDVVHDAALLVSALAAHGLHLDPVPMPTGPTSAASAWSVLEAMRRAIDEPSKAKARSPKRRGRMKADYQTVQKEARVAADWERARDSGEYKFDFAKRVGMTLADLDRLLDRVAARNRRSDK